jgi:hypothetical protein
MRRDDLVSKARRAVGRWQPLMSWAIRGTGGKVPLHKRAVLRLASLGLEAEMALWRSQRSV